MENWQLILVYLILGLSLAIAGCLIIFVWLFHLTALFIPALFAILLVFAEYVYFMFKSFKEGKMRRVVALGTILALIFVLPYSTYQIVTPQWSFTVTTDKSTYNLGENVQISVSLENLGFISHSFKSSIGDPIAVSIERVYDKDPTITTQVWYTPLHTNITEFTIPPHRFLKRTFTWNQTLIPKPWAYNQTYMPGTYYIKAFIPDAREDSLVMEYYLFSACTKINVTST